MRVKFKVFLENIRLLKQAIIQEYLDNQKRRYWLFMVILTFFHAPFWLGIILAIVHNPLHLLYAFAWFYTWNITTYNKLNDLELVVFITNLFAKIISLIKSETATFIRKLKGDY